MPNTKTIVSLCLLFVLFPLSYAKAADIETEWRDFQKDSRAFLKTIPAKTTTGASTRIETRFTDQQILTRAFIDQKATERRAKFKQLNFFQAIRPGVSNTAFKVRSFLNIDEFTEKGLVPVFTLREIEALKLEIGDLDVQPWSGSYWPMYQGGPAARYASNGFTNHSGGWKSSYDFVLESGGLGAVLERADASEIDELSPAEKYDLLIGAPKAGNANALGFLTASLWNETGGYRDDKGNVETWMGYCHGWAPAALEDQRPTKTIESATAVKDLNVQFYPSDLKALSTLLWAKGDFSNSFIGGRCNDKTPATDPESGRLLNPDCFDVDPSVWHLIVANQLGQLKRGLVIDATYDYQVWNQPLFHFEMSYFDPQTGRQKADSKSAMVHIAKFTKDKFKKFRHAEATDVVGVRMTIQYVAETEPSHASNDSPNEDGVQTVSYLYDLELNAKGEIIGGEWYQNAHPDFLWVPRTGQRPVSTADAQIPASFKWDPRTPLPRFWRDLAVRSSEQNGQPVAKIVEALLSEASN